MSLPGRGRRRLTDNRSLGIHITVAVKWQRAVAGDRGAYTAEVSRRQNTQEPT
ncbi:hypothetical protein [Streptomyces sp. NPDC006784]|uniref:hypothetical protein n=1 Tax=Streptomyces sp. NPDC006784 TaxID=3364764 RepID=UPI0036825531